ncbi:lipocalin family protein [Aldersonia sp. NBC_00410]|uniref:lipocalin family protein n=1 Tax=Aldersonia sp. NBC_00410 TaxID=2975954 RepID=UPI002251F910|nr:lipocalin family protein [Aldersonia sp. NBC_00410]MCX5041733.1 lipocalin family protein [Aldersonia sp. NBC_00410]
MRHTFRAAAVALAGLAAIGFGTATATAQPAAPGPLQPISSLDLDRYLGRWHQLAAIPQPFSVICARDTTAQYGLTPEGNVSVRNDCTTWANTPNSITGTAQVVDPVTKAQLRVTFPQNGSADPTDVFPNYIVTAIAPDYSWALVGDPFRTSGFLLSRTPALTDAQWRAARTAIADAGYNGCVFLTSPTTGGRSDVSPLC